MEWTEAGVSASRANTHRCLRERSYTFQIPNIKPLLNHRQCQKCLTWTEENKNWTVAQWDKVLFLDENKFWILF